MELVLELLEELFFVVGRNAEFSLDGRVEEAFAEVILKTLPNLVGVLLDDCQSFN